jgi:pimeloyl-ACP methyl ester carboxylesterase
MTARTAGDAYQVPWWSFIALGAAIAASLAPAAAATPIATAGPSAEQSASSSAVVWKRCAGREQQWQLQCAKVSVPLDWTRPNGKHIKLAVIRHLAANRQTRIGSMFINPGGPGESGVELVRASGDDLDEWGGGRFDIVSWDPRGTNDSSPVECFTNAKKEAAFWLGAAIPTTLAESTAYEQRMIELARRCGETSGDLLSHISTADSARDLDALRELVGESQLTYVGLSYGTILGQTYANLYPHRVRAMVLDAVVDAVAYTDGAEARFANSTSSTDEVFDQFVALCEAAGATRCALAGHAETVAQRVARLFAAARAVSIPAPHANPPGELSYSDLLLTTFNPLRTPTEWTRYAQQLDAAANGDASRLEDAAREMRTPYAFAKATTSAAIQCLDGPARQPLSAWPEVIERLASGSALWGPVLGWWQWAPCAANWPARSNDRYAGPWNAVMANPILLINNRYDPATGYRNAQVAERRLGNAVLLTLDSYGHPTFQLRSRCIDDARTRYLVDLVVPPRGTVCSADEVPFATPP